jgi:serine phosphatase RsbU (regulator of sigma subunit)
MFAAPPHSLVEAVCEVLRAHYGAVGHELLLVDYRLVELRPLLHDQAAVAIAGSLPGQVFVEQRPLREPHDPATLHLPVTVRGDRLGVLRLRLAEPADAATEEELVDLAVALAHDLRAADDVTDRYRRARRRERLTLAAEMQWQLLPGRALAGAAFSLAGQLEPAYSIRGDNFDWSSDDRDLTLAVTNGMGEGIQAALLTNLAVSALRNARLAGALLSDQACLADQAIYAEHRGARHVSTLLLRFDLASGRVEAVDAGSPWLLRLRGGRLERVPLEAQLPLGMFDGTVYVEQQFTVEPGDRLFVVSDGVHGASVGGRSYSDGDRIARTVTATRLLPPLEAVRAVLDDLQAFRRSDELTDDAAVVCLDWIGEKE